MSRVGGVVAWVMACLPATGQQVRIECLSFPKQAAEQIELLVGPEETVEVTLQSHALSDVLLVPRLPVWKFGVSETDDEGKFRFKTYAEAKPRKPARQLLIFIRKGASASDGFRIITLDASEAGFGEGKMFIMNLARRDVAGQVGGKRFVLQPGRHVIFKPAADRGDKLCFAALRYQRDEKWRTFFSTNWPILENARGLVFTYDDPRSKNIKLHSIVDSLFEAEEPE